MSQEIAHIWVRRANDYIIIGYKNAEYISVIRITDMEYKLVTSVLRMSFGILIFFFGILICLPHIFALYENKFSASS